MRVEKAIMKKNIEGRSVEKFVIIGEHDVGGGMLQGGMKV